MSSLENMFMFIQPLFWSRLQICHFYLRIYRSEDGLHLCKPHSLAYNKGKMLWGDWEQMKIISVKGENVEPGIGGAPADSFDRSFATYETEKEKKTLTVTYVRYFAKVLAEKGIYDEESAGVPVNKMIAVLFLEKYPEVKELRHYFNDEKQVLELFEGFSLDSFKAKYGSLL